MSSGSDYSVTKLYDVGFKKYSNCLLLRLKIIVPDFFKMSSCCFTGCDLLYAFLSCELPETENVFCYLCPKSSPLSNL